MFIDANIFISAWLGRNEAARKCKEFFKKIESGEQRAITSVLVFDEVLYTLEIRTGDREKSLAAVRKMSILPNLKICEVSPRQLSNSFEIYSKHGLKPRDALHIATMLENGVSTMLSFDKDFDGVKGIERIEP